MEVIVNGVKTNYQVFGEGKPFLILHGWGSNSERWVPVADAIAKAGFRVVIPDLPGFGKSELPQEPWNVNNFVNWTEELAKTLGLKDFYLLGHSFGGALASKIAVKHAQDIKKLFLVSAACVRKKTASKSVMKGLSKIVRAFYFLPFYGFFRKVFYRLVIGKSDYLYVQGLLKETYIRVISEDLTFHLPFIKVPTVIIWGDKDFVTSVEDAELINQKIGGSKLIMVNGFGHDLNRKAPGLLAQNVLNNI